MNDLSSYGWYEQRFDQKQHSSFKDLPHGRVTVVHRTCYEVIAEDGLYQCELTGNILYGKSPVEYPCTGDWIIFQPIDKEKGIIMDILPREKALYRRKSGTTSTKQAIAVHVDKAFIVQSLDNSFKARRIERFMVQILDEGITPVLILTKADLDFDETEITNSLKHLSDKIAVFKTSIYFPEQIDLLKKYIRKGETVVFTGLSGAGKSSLINALSQKDSLHTSAISDFTGKGRHTSTRREMILLDDSGVLIDTPGVREFGITAGDTDTLSSVLNISDLENSCKFMDCTHTNEPGCAVIEAVNSGVLDKEVYESYLKLRREAYHFSTAVHEKRKRDKSFAKVIKEVKKIKGYR